MPLGDKAKAAWPLRAATLKQQAIITRRSGKAASDKLVWNQHRKVMALLPSDIAPDLNWSQLYAICRGGQSGKVIDLLARRWLPLGHPSAASGACAVIQISSSKRQSGKRQASLKAAQLLFEVKHIFFFFSFLFFFFFSFSFLIRKNIFKTTNRINTLYLKMDYNTKCSTKCKTQMVKQTNKQTQINYHDQKYLEYKTK